ARLLERIAEMPEAALDLDLLDLEVGDPGLELRVPVDQPLVLVDQPLLVEVDEHLADCGREAVVHGEALAGPVAARAQTAQLPGDGAAGFCLPAPHPLDELLTPEIGAPLAFGLELALDHH